MIDKPIVSRSKFRTTSIKPTAIGEKPASHRQMLIENWNQTHIESATIGIIGAGGLGGRFCQNLARLSVGHIVFCDEDTINPSNLNRQFFYQHQLYNNKALMLFENLKAECIGSTLLEAYSMEFQEVVEEYPKAFLNVDLLACLVDNDETRRYASEYGLEHDIPVIFSAVSRTTRNGYVFVQDKGGACFSCMKPAKPSEKQPCAEPSVIYIHEAVIGIATYATVCKILGWNLNWNYYELFLDSESRVLSFQKIDCEVCGGV